MLAGYIGIIHLANRPLSTLNSESYYSVRNLSFLLDAPAHTTVYVWCIYVYGVYRGSFVLTFAFFAGGSEGPSMSADKNT